MARTQFRALPASVLLPLQVLSTTTNTRFVAQSQAEPRARDGSFALPLPKVRSASPCLAELIPSPLPPPLQSAGSGQRGSDRTDLLRSEEHTSELQSRELISY